MKDCQVPGGKERTKLCEGWHNYDEKPGVDRTKPGIYRWVIEGGGVYIGKYSRISRPTREYRRNVERILNGEPYHISTGGFRRIHCALALAVREGRTIALTIMANGEPGDLNRLEQEFIQSEGATLNGRG